jgi:hypothetical protein
MARLGHSSTRAAMIYQHATRDRDRAIAKALGGLVQQVRATAANRPAVTHSSACCGPCVARLRPTEPSLITETTCFAPTTWCYTLERAKGIEPS